MEKLEAEVAVMLAEEGLVLLEADVAPGVEVEIGEAVRHLGDGRVVRRAGELFRPLHDVVVTERRRRIFPVRLGGGGRDEMRSRRRGDAHEQRAAGQFKHLASFEKRRDQHRT